VDEEEGWTRLTRVKLMTHDTPVNLIMKATRLIAEALRLLESATITTTLDADTGVTDKLDFSFLDTPLNKVDWGFDYQKRLSKAFDSWNTHEKQFVGLERQRPLVTVRDLLAISEDELRDQPFVGRETINRVNAVLGKHGMRLNV
jgi:hypothetical protein